MKTFTELSKYLVLMSEQSFTAAAADLSQQMLVQMVHTRDVNQLSSGSELDLTLVIKNLQLPLKHQHCSVKHIKFEVSGVKMRKPY